MNTFIPSYLAEFLALGIPTLRTVSVEGGGGETTWRRAMRDEDLRNIAGLVCGHTSSSFVQVLWIKAIGRIKAGSSRIFISILFEL